MAKKGAGGLKNLRARVVAVTRAHPQAVRYGASAAVAVFVIVCMAAGYYAVTFSRMIDARLHGERDRVIPRVFARPLELATEEVALQSLVNRVAVEVSDAVPQIEISATGDFEPVAGDESLLRQALLNVARNAAEAAGGQPFAGRVMVRGSVEQLGGRLMQRIAVADNGPGIPAADLAKIFLPFYTTKVNGTGLGLAIVQKIVVQHGGSVEARNQPEGGAELIIWLPLSRQDVLTPAPLAHT